MKNLRLFNHMPECKPGTTNILQLYLTVMRSRSQCIRTWDMDWWGKEPIRAKLKRSSLASRKCGAEGLKPKITVSSIHQKSTILVCWRSIISHAFLFIICNRWAHMFLYKFSNKVFCWHKYPHLHYKVFLLRVILLKLNNVTSDFSERVQF
jgi:hypothetical protein